MEPIYKSLEQIDYSLSQLDHLNNCNPSICLCGLNNMKKNFKYYTENYERILDKDDF